MNMDEHYKEAISLLACGELPERERDAVERHLAECASCRDDYEALQRLCGRIRNLAEQDDRAEAPGGLSERLAKSLRRQAHVGHRAALVAAACVLVGLAAWAILAAEKNDARVRTKQSPAVAVIPIQHVVTAVGLPLSSHFSYYRALAQSPDALDQMLSRDNALLLRPERSERERTWWK
jgi:anti-sigma factor RsiW